MEQSAKPVLSGTENEVDTLNAEPSPAEVGAFPRNGKETREIVTPYAFQVAPELLGTPLASPMRRAMAQLLDISFLYFISSANALIFALVAAVTFLKAGNNLAKKSSAKGVTQILRVVGVAILAWLLFTIVDEDTSALADTQRDHEAAAVVEPLVVGGTALLWQQCDNDMSCLASVAVEFGESQAEIGGTLPRLDEVFSALTQDSGLDDDQITSLRTIMYDAFHAQQSIETAQHSDTDDNLNGIADEKEAMRVVEKPHNESFLSSLRQIIHDGKSLLTELGWGFGWAALYYSVFPASLKGYTPGKWLTGIRVLRLDGRSPTLWESFGRYGGYGAGFATGFLGFFQVFWDANRQAIQDKIAETLVVRHAGPRLSTSKLNKVKGTEGEGI
ncbi:RDD family protein [Aestuariibacter sp. A3R04]|uniref:RDD family protein n=1 Tax=Aestuariibacter sp. A3R04 TaxID=2841571 RepID=UPI001C08B8B5|nr:RDD family protein [Aestuariibacter sp. A3R04]MBU3022774.1 RDD family protein [Aestuariibacter sp. A3R04]